MSPRAHTLRTPHPTGGYNEIIVGDADIATFRLNGIHGRNDGQNEMSSL